MNTFGGCLAEWLTPRTGGPGFKPCLSHCFLKHGTLLHLSLFTQVYMYKWVPAIYCWGTKGGCVVTPDFK